jgi:probable F420-dependent oxidoreductase
VTDRPFRFGAVIFTPREKTEWVRKVRLAEQLGYDVVTVSDHLGMPAPVPTMLLAAEATERIRIGTLVFNTAFYQPTVLARDIATLDAFSGGRIEVGLGAGYDKAQFDAADIPWIAARERVDHLERTLLELKKVFADPDRSQSVQRGGPPILVAGRGDRILRLAAEHADIIAFTGTTQVSQDGDGLRLGGLAEVTDQITRVRELLGDRVDDVELNIPIHRVLPPGTTGGVADVWGNELHLDPDEVAALPSLLIGTPEENADRLRERRKEFGLTYYSVLEPELEAFAQIIEVLR